MKRNRDEDEFSPLTMNSLAAERYIDHSSIDHHSVYSTMLEDFYEIKEGDLSSLEKRLVAQITSLDAVYTSLLTKASGIIEWEGFQAAEKCMTLALKAQSQSANTMKILFEMKQPRHITFANQANVANQQMINNGSMSLSPEESHARGKNNSGSVKSQNELIQINEVNDATLDTRVETTPLNVNAKKYS